MLVLGDCAELVQYQEGIPNPSEHESTPETDAFGSSSFGLEQQRHSSLVHE